MGAILSQVHWIPVLAGTILAFLAGWLWYSPVLFGKGWAAGSGVDLGTASDMPVFAMVAQVVALFLMALVIGITAVANALITAILIIITVAVFVVSTGAFVRKSGTALAVDCGFVLVAGCIMIAAQALL